MIRRVTISLNEATGDKKSNRSEKGLKRRKTLSITLLWNWMSGSFEWKTDIYPREEASHVQ